MVLLLILHECLYIYSHPHHIYTGDHVPTVLIAIAGRSNGLGPVLSGNTALPVINCPPVSSDWAAQDVWSSLRMPSGHYNTSILQYVY